MNSGRITIARVFFVAATLLVVSLVSTYWIGIVAIKSNATVAAHRTVMHQLDQVVSTLRDAETAQRGFLMTGDEQALGPYGRALDRARLSFAGLRDIGNRGDLPSASVEDVLRQAQEKVTELEQGVQVRRNGTFEPALSLVRATESKRTLEKLQASIGRMASAEQVRLKEAARRASRADTWRTGVFLLTISFNLAFLAWSYARVLREMHLREQVASELQRQKELLATTLASIGDGVMAADANGRLTFLNPEAERLTGWLNAEAATKEFSSIFRIVDEKAREPVENPVDRILRGAPPVAASETALLLNRAGAPIPIGNTVAPIRQPGGALEGVVVVFRDISELVAARETLARGKEELELLVQARTAKLREMVNELQHISYSITHDMRAPLRAMSAFAQLLLEETAVVESAAHGRDYCRRILVAAGRMDTLIRDALSFTRAVLHELPLQPINLSILLRGMIDTYPNLQPKLADILIEGNLPVIIGNESLLTQCFSNLLDNAVKFVDPGVRPRVRIWAETNGTTTRIWIEDNGIGIAKHAQPRLFGMFQKLDTQYEGTGIGLAIVRKVAQRMGGSVGVESDAGRGSRFWVVLKTASSLSG